MTRLWRGRAVSIGQSHLEIVGEPWQVSLIERNVVREGASRSEQRDEASEG